MVKIWKAGEKKNFKKCFGQKNPFLATWQKKVIRPFLCRIQFSIWHIARIKDSSIIWSLEPLLGKKWKIRKRIARTAEWIVKMTNLNILHDSLTRCEANAVVRLSKFDLEVFLIIFWKKFPWFLLISQGPPPKDPQGPFFFKIREKTHLERIILEFYSKFGDILSSRFRGNCSSRYP